MRAAIVLALSGLALELMCTATAAAGDWPQFMRSPEHSGDAGDEALALPLGLIAQVKLDDAVLTGPAVVGGRAYVVDQMGTACCVDPDAGKVLWKSSPDGGKAMGGNTSSPAVHKGRVYFGTTARAFHVLDAADGKVVRTVRLDWPVVSAPAIANDRVYFQTLGAVVHCLDLDGKELWAWDHYKSYTEPAERAAKEKPRRGHPGSYDKPHYGGGEVAVSGRRVVTSAGWDLLCLEDQGERAELLWCSRAAAGRDGAVPMSPSIAAGSIYVGGMGADGVLALMRFSLADGTMGKGDSLNQGAYPWISPACRGDMVIGRNNGWLKDEIQICRFDGERRTLWQHPDSATSVVGSHALAGQHVVVGTLTGELMAIGLAGKAAGPPFVFKTPHGLGIGSSPAVSGGRVFFGCDDGYLYVLGPVLGPGGERTPHKDAELSIHQPRSRTTPAGSKAYAWPSTGGNAGNTSFADDAELSAPLRVRWAVRGFGHFKSPCVADERDVFTVTLNGRIVTCIEQTTGRMRWRRQVPAGAAGWSNSSGLLADGGRLYVPCPNDRMAGQLLCLDAATGRTLWSAPIGKRGVWDRGSPLPADGKVVFGHTVAGTPPVPVVEAWDAATGEPAWKVEMNVSGNRSDAPNGCTDGRTVYFTLGNEAWQWKQEFGKQRGEAVAIDGRTGKVLWRSSELFGCSAPVLTGERLLLNEYASKLSCLSTRDYSVLWQNKSSGYLTRYSVGAEVVAARGYGGSAATMNLADGQARGGFDPGGQLGGDDHACGTVVLTPKLSLAITVSGLHVRDIRTGRLLWRSLGFAPRACVNAAVANGRVFFPSAASGMVYCFEPAAGAERGGSQP